MTLELNDIEAILRENPNKADVNYAQTTRSELFMHLYGYGLETYLKTINSFENAEQYAVRKKYARSNRDLMARVLRPIDKVFSAAGGATYYNLRSTNESDFRNKLRAVENGLTLRKWMSVYWLQAYLADPMGLIFIEIDNNGEAYPTYKSSADVVSYKLSGRHAEYVVFKAKAPDGSHAEVAADSPAYYRVVDDRADCLVKYADGRASIVDEFPNYFGRVPAIIASDIPVINTDWFDSPVQPVVQLANEYLRECSVKSVYKLMHGFPKAWEYRTECPTCAGTGQLRGEKCPTCAGTGAKPQRDVSEVRLLPIPQVKDDPILAPNIAGFVTPPIDTWSCMTDELSLLECLIFQTLWGTKQSEDAENETATGRFIDTQPVNDRLTGIAEAAESVEGFITDMMGVFYYGASYKGSSVGYGRRFQIESADALWDKYQSARAAGAPVPILDNMLSDYMQAKNNNNSLEQAKQMKLIALEPFVHLTAAQVGMLNLPEEDYMSKVYFGDFVASLAGNELLVMPLNELREKLKEFTINKKTVKKNETI
jgi:hypothetical protein